MVGDGGNKDTQHNGPGLAKTRCEDQGKELRLVAHFGEGDDAVEIRKASKMVDSGRMV
jgi:hypothetical protein